jgi:hypothetical protein
MREIQRLALASEGFNTINFPVGGRVLAVVMNGMGGDAALAVLADPAAREEPRTFYVTRKTIADHGDDIVLEFMGAATEEGRAPLYVFDLVPKKGAAAIDNSKATAQGAGGAALAAPKGRGGRGGKKK